MENIRTFKNNCSTISRHFQELLNVSPHLTFSFNDPQVSNLNLTCPPFNIFLNLLLKSTGPQRNQGFPMFTFNTDSLEKHVLEDLRNDSRVLLCNICNSSR